MNFAELNTAVEELRHSLHSFLPEDAFPEINIRKPVGHRDEASFMRLVNWSYVLLFEAGRVVIPYLLKLPSETTNSADDLRESRQVVHSLRTWMAHNLGFSSERDNAIRRHIENWFITQCGLSSPNDDSSWGKAFESLCAEVGLIIMHCQSIIKILLDDPDDKEIFITDFRIRVDRFWPAHKFDQIVSDACERMGLKLDVVKFREARLSKWRQLLETVHEDDYPEMQVTSMIESDILDFTNDISPINGEDIMREFDIDPGPEVGDMLRRARMLYRSGIRDRQEILEKLGEQTDG